jgi:hypothetical protein
MLTYYTCAVQLKETNLPTSFDERYLRDGTIGAEGIYLSIFW